MPLLRYFGKTHSQIRSLDPQPPYPCSHLVHTSGYKLYGRALFQCGEADKNGSPGINGDKNTDCTLSSSCAPRYSRRYLRNHKRVCPTSPTEASYSRYIPYNVLQSSTHDFSIKVQPIYSCKHLRFHLAVHMLVKKTHEPK